MNNIKTPKYVIDLARKNRLNLTPTEKIMWEALRKKQLDGKKFRCQHPIYRYILDFYCHSCKLAIEIDGDSHKNRHDYDKDMIMISSETNFLRAWVLKQLDLQPMKLFLI